MEMANTDRFFAMPDKVFHSLDKIKKTGKRNLNFIIPLKRNSSLV